MTSADHDLDPRTRMVRSAARMFRERGVHGVGMRQIAADANGPRGSLQRYFPGGKDQVVVEALEYSTAAYLDRLRSVMRDAPDLATVVRSVIAGWRGVLVDSAFREGCPMASVVIDAAASDVLRVRSHELLTEWRAVVASGYERFGYAPAAAADEALLLVASIEGALVFDRAARSTESLDAVERMFLARGPKA